MLQNFQD